MAVRLAFSETAFGTASVSLALCAAGLDDDRSAAAGEDARDPKTLRSLDPVLNLGPAIPILPS
jgi:hypothetical protein